MKPRLLVCLAVLVSATGAWADFNDLRPEVKNFLACTSSCKGGDQVDCINRCEAASSGKSLSRVRCEADCEKQKDDVEYARCKRSCASLYR